MLPPNTLRDKPTTLNLEGYPGNDLVTPFVLGDGVPMPPADQIQCVVMQPGGSTPMGSAYQPGVTVDGRTFTVHFLNTTRYTKHPVEIRFYGRKRLAGYVSFDRKTIDTPVGSSDPITLNLLDGGVVSVSVVFGASEGGGDQSTSYTLTNVTAGRYRHNFGRAPSATILNASGVEIGAALQHIYETGSTITNEIEVASNQPITGRLILRA